MNIYECASKDDFEIIIKELLEFGTDAAHSRIEFEGNRPVVTAKTNWCSRVIRYLKRIFCCKCEHPAEVAAKRIAEFFASNQKHIDSTNIPTYISALEKMQTIKHAPKNSPRITSLYQNFLKSGYERGKSAIQSLLTIKEKVEGEKKQLEVEYNKLGARNLDLEHSNLAGVRELNRLQAIIQARPNAAGVHSAPPDSPEEASEKLARTLIAQDEAAVIERVAQQKLKDAEATSARLVTAAVREVQVLHDGAEQDIAKKYTQLTAKSKEILEQAEKQKAQILKQAEDEALKIKATALGIVTKFKKDVATMDVTIQCSDGSNIKIHSSVLQARLPENITRKLFMPSIVKKQVAQKEQVDQKAAAAAESIEKNIDFTRFKFTAKAVQTWVDYLYTTMYPNNLSINDLLEFYKLAEHFSPPAVNGVEVEGLATQLKREIVARVQSNPQLYFDIIPGCHPSHPALPFLVRSLNLFLSGGLVSTIPQEKISRFLNWIKSYRISIKDLSHNPPHINVALGLVYSGVLRPTEQDLKLAFHFFEGAGTNANKENALGLTHFALCLINRIGRPNKEIVNELEVGTNYLKICAYNYFCPVAQYHYALLLLKHEPASKKDAKILLERSALQKYPAAVSFLEICNKNGTWNAPAVGAPPKLDADLKLGADQKDRKEADYKGLLAQMDSKDAAVRTDFGPADALIDKILDKRNPNKAATLAELRALAERNVPAMYRLAQYAEKVLKDKDAAVIQYLNARENGLAYAQEDLRRLGVGD